MKNIKDKIIGFLIDNRSIAFVILSVGFGGLGLISAILSVSPTAWGAITYLFSLLGGILFGVMLYILYDKLLERIY